MRLTKLKYKKETKTNYVTDKSNEEVVERLGELEDILGKYNLLDSNQELERLIILGKAGYNRVKLAMGHKIYFIAGKKIKKAILVGYANNGLSLDQLIIKQDNESATIPFTHIFISRREAKRARKARQLYKLNKEQYAKIFGTKPYKKSYLLETVRGTDDFIVVQKVFKAYFKQISKSYSKEELEKNFKFDIDAEFKNERMEYLERAKFLNTKWL